MNVKELREALANLPDDMEVILQKDAEGNGYSPLEGADAEAIYLAETTWSGECYADSWTAGEAGFDEDEWDDIKQDNPRCLVLFPVN